MKTRKLVSIPLLISGLIFISTFTFAQVGINTDSSMAHPSAGLDVKFTDKGVLFPRMTMAERDAIINPANGLIVICTDCVAGGTLSIFLNGTWRIAPVAPCNSNLSAPTAGVNVSTTNKIIWNWSSVTDATGYKWNTTNDYGTATDMGTATSVTETELTCNTSYSRYVWAYNSCVCSSSTTLTQGTLGCSTTNCGQPITDSRDGKTYNTLQIGSQCWLKENLNIGTKLNALTGADQTNNNTIEKYCYDDLNSNCEIYGGLYQWDELMNYSSASNSNPSGRQGICPADWHIPSDAEWCQMELFLDPTVICDLINFRGTDIGGKLKETGTNHWASPNIGATNSSGFTAVPGGEWDYTLNIFSGLHIAEQWWSSTSYLVEPTLHYMRMVHTTVATMYRGYQYPEIGLSARCVKDNCDISPPTGGVHLPSQNQIIWNWNAVTGASGYKWNVTDDYNTAIDMGLLTTKTETGLACNTTYVRYAWAYSSCGYSAATSLTQTTQTSTNPPGPCPGIETVSYGGIIYNTAQIGCQCWLKENLNIGTRIDTTIEQTNNTIIEKYCYDENESNCTEYGGLYLWNEMMNYTSSSNSNPSGRQGICPSGWHIPSDAEWCQMETYLDPTVSCSIIGETGTDAGGKMKETGTTHWYPPNTGATNSSGFTALPGGQWMDYTYPSMFNGLTSSANFWSATEYNTFDAWYRALLSLSAAILHGVPGKNDYAYSVRCVKD